MKTQGTLVLWAVAGLLLCQQAGYAEIGVEMLENPGFEGTYSSSGTAPYWYDNSVGNITVIYSDSTTDKHSGSHAQKLLCTQPDPNAAIGAMQFRAGTFLPIQNGHAYRLSVWIKGENLSSDQLNLSIRQLGWPYRGYLNKYIHVTNQWTQYTFEQVSSYTDSGPLFFITMSGTGTLHLDDASFQEINQTTNTYVQTIPNTRVSEASFAMHRHFRYSNGQWDDRWPTEPHGMIRFWDASTGWKDVEPIKGTWNWTTLDTYIASARQANPNMQFIYTFGVTPQWAALYPNQPGAYGNGTASEPADMQDWIDFVTAVATRYKGTIKYYEIWNEPYFSLFWSGSPAKLAELAQVARTALKAVDPDIQVVSPSCTPEYLDLYFHAGGASATDITASHFYPLNQSGPPELITAHLQAIRRVMHYNNVQTHLWNTEGGFAVESSTHPAGGGYLSNAEAYKQIIRWYIINRTEGAEMIAYYAWDNATFGLIDYPTADIKKKCAPALGQAFDWLIDRIITFRQVADADGTWTVALNRGGISGDDLITWNPNGAAVLDISTLQMKTAIDMYGNVSDISTVSTLSISDSPIYLAHSPSYLQGEEPRVYLPMDDLQYGFTSDMSGFGTNGQVHGADLDPNGLAGGAMNFNGPSGGTKYIDFADDPTLKIAGEMSVSAWVYPRTAPDTEGRTVASTYIWQYGGSKGWNLGAVWCGGNNPFSFAVCAGGVDYWADDNAFFNAGNLNKWHHVVGVFKPSTYIRLYVDGVLVAENKTNIPAAIDYSPDYGLVVGQRSNGQSRWDGLIDEFRMYPYSLCDREVQKLYQSGHRVAYLKLNTIANNTTPDYSLFNHPGTVNNVALSDQSVSDKSAEFAGASGQTQNIALGNDPALKIAGEMSVSTWVYARSAPANEGRTAASTYYYQPYADKGWNLGSVWTGSPFRFMICSAGTDYFVEDTHFFDAGNLNKWRHVVAVFKPSTYIRLYVDGVLVCENTTNIPASIDYSANDGLVIGERSNGGQSAWDGYIDEFEMYKRALTADEVSRLYEKFH